MALESVFAARLDLPCTQSRGAVWHKCSWLGLVRVSLCSWGEDPSTPRVWGSAPDIDRAPKIRTLEKRRDWGNYTSSPVGRPRGDMLIACLAEKCPRRRVKSQAM